MGGRLSMPKGPDGLSEASKPTSANAPARLSRSRGIINGRVSLSITLCNSSLTYRQTVMAPLAAITMAGLLFVYARTSIRAAKLNAQKHREADGGQISWHKESMRRHGTLERLDDDRSTFKEALMGDVKKVRKERQEGVSAAEKGDIERSDNDRELRGILGKRS
jgi:hypothetical protein